MRTIPSRLLSDMLDDHEAQESATGVSGSDLIERTQAYPESGPASRLSQQQRPIV